jgi:hypothetical protein
MANHRQPGPVGQHGVNDDINDGTLIRQASPHPGPLGTSRSTNPHVHLVIFPGETTTQGVTLGRIYVVGGHGESYPMAGGPPPGKGYRDLGGHTAGVTPAGRYVLGHQEHHTTKNWPMSVIPWGALLREHDGEVQYQVSGHWNTATGAQGAVTKAAMQFYERSGAHPALPDVVKKVRTVFYQSNGELLPSWKLNDFGIWSWNLKKNGIRTPFYIHTTPENEAETATNSAVLLAPSHGCIHIRPLDRDAMMRKGYLKPGIKVEVKSYGQHGPP